MPTPTTATLIAPDGRSREVTPINGKRFTLHELQMLVGGRIETYPAKDGRTIVCNENGRLKGLDENLEASQLLLRPLGVLVGTVLVCPPEMIR